MVDKRLIGGRDMSSEKKIYVDEFIQEIEIDRTYAGEGLRKSFVHCFYERIPESEQGSLNLVYLNDRIKGKPIVVDGYFFDDEDRTMYLVIADFNNFEDTHLFNRKKAEDKIKALRNFVTFSADGSVSEILEFSTPEYDLAELIRENESSSLIDRYRLVVFTDQEVSEKFVFLSQEPLLNHPVDIQIWDLERLFEFVSSGKEREPITLDFSNSPIPLTRATLGHGFCSYLGVMPANLLADIYKEHGSRLLEGNVRSFLTLKSGVNKQIYHTVCNDPGRFFIFNNGIAITAKNLEFDKSGALVKATDFQIINGGQTTATLSKAKYDSNNPRDLEKISVAMKLTEIGEELSNEEAQELIRKISKSSNTQNKVSDADLSSNHEFHIQLEKQSERILTERLNGYQYGTYWFYERSRGRYEQKQMFMTKNLKERFKRDHPKNQVFKKEDVAKVHMSWQGHPDIVSKGAAKTFCEFMDRVVEKWEHREQTGEFGDQYYKSTIAMILMWKALEASIPHQSWYQKGYRANIITYTLSIFAKYYNKTFGVGHFDFENIWKAQAIPSDLLNTLLDIAENILVKVLEWQDRKKLNVTEWAKMHNCWEHAQWVFEHQLKFKLPINLGSLAKTNEQVQEEKHQAKVVASIDKEVGNIIEAMDYKYWPQALKYAQTTGVLTPSGLKTIQTMTFIALGRIPTDRTVKQAFKYLHQLREEGFDH